MKQSTIKRVSRYAEAFDRKFGKDNWCFYNQGVEPHQENTSLIIRDQGGFLVTAFLFDDDELRELHSALNICDKTISNIIMSSVWGITHYNQNIIDEANITDEA